MILLVVMFFSLSFAALTTMGGDEVPAAEIVVTPTEINDEPETLHVIRHNVQEELSVEYLSFVTYEPPLVIEPPLLAEPPVMDLPEVSPDSVEEDLTIIFDEMVIRDFTTRNWTPLGERSETAWAMFRFLRDSGWDYHQIAAGLGNFMGECSLWYEPNYSARYKGICQWEPRRWDKLVSQGFAMDRFEGQLAAMIWELENDYPDVYGRFLAAATVADALKILTNEYEVGDNYSMRLYYAEQFAGILEIHRS